MTSSDLAARLAATAPTSAAAPEWTMRVPREDEWGALVRVGDHAFGEHQTAESSALERSVHELDRTIAVFDGNELVGGTAIYSLEMTVPGGPRAVAGVTWVAVLPTHRRRGILSAMMRRQLHELHDTRREPVAALWASEPAIYGRFGYGAASRHLSLEIPRSAQALASPASPASRAGLRARLVEPEQSLDLVEPVFDAVRLRRPGLYARDDRWRRRDIFDPESDRQGKGPLRCVVVEDADGPRGYARYAVAADWVPTGTASVVHVREAFAVDPAATAVLFGYLCDLDLTATVRVRHRPLDDPLVDLLNDVRAARVRVTDGLYVRLVDVDRALAERLYSAPVDVVLEVSDPLCPWNAGRWRLSTDGDAAQCSRTDRDADLALSVRELGAAYLGSANTLTRLAAAGRVTELSPGALHAASRAFSWDVEPWCSSVF